MNLTCFFLIILSSDAHVSHEAVEPERQPHNLRQVAECPEGVWCASYYDNNNLSGLPLYQQQDARIDFDWQGSGPQGLGINHFSVRWLGDFRFEEGSYLFRATTDDGMRIWVDDQLLLDAWEEQAQVTQEIRVHIAGGLRQIRVDYYENTGLAIAQVAWEKVSQGVLNNDSPLGINITALNYFSSELTLIDVMPVSGGWYTQNPSTWDTGEQAALDLDDAGWVRSLPAADAGLAFSSVAALVLNGFEGNYPAGEYVVLYEGEGLLTYGLDGVKKQVGSRPGRDLVTVTQPTNGGIVLRIEKTDPNATGNYIRNIRVIMPGYRCAADPYNICEGGDSCAADGCTPLEELVESLRFHPQFLRDLRRYKVIRFMDFLRTNTTQVEEWHQRPKLTDGRWNTTSGAPLELAIQLANLAQADPWLNIPVKASNDYILEFARLVHEQLDPQRTLYIEYGNEIWNTAFAAGAWVEQQAVAEWPESSASPYTKRFSWQGKRTVEIINMFKNVWGRDATRIKGIMGGFGANFWASEQVLDCPLWEGGPCYPSVAGLAIAPYFGGYLGEADQAATLQSWTSERDGGLNSLFAELYPKQWQVAAAKQAQTSASSLDQAFAIMEGSKAVAGKRAVRLMAYEGGQHLVGVGSQLDNPLVETLFTAANRDQRMGQLYTAYLQGWKDRGGALLCTFLSVEHATRFGSWGSKEYQNQEDAPKFSAIMRFLDDNPCWWDGCAEE